jgi:hypothetical protein
MFPDPKVRYRMTTKSNSMTHVSTLLLMIGLLGACSGSPYKFNWNSEDSGPPPNLPVTTVNPLEPTPIPMPGGYVPTDTTWSTTQGGASGSVDIVWVIDNSGSMGNDQDAIADNAEVFTSHIAGMDYRILIATTHQGAPLNTLPYNERKCTDRIISSANSAQFAACARVGVGSGYGDGTGYEEGLEAVHRALSLNQEALRSANNGVDFPRPGADLQILFVSDEEDQPDSGTWESHVTPGSQNATDLATLISELGVQDMVNGVPYDVALLPGGWAAENYPDRIDHLADGGHEWDSLYTYVPTVANHVAFLKSLKTDGEKIATHAIVNTRLDGLAPNADCHKRAISEEVGTRYQLVAADPVIGGSITDIVGGITPGGACGDWTGVMDDLGAQVSGLAKCFGPLSPSPVSGAASIHSVTVNGTAVAYTYQAYSKKVCITGGSPPAGAAIVVSYAY